MNTFRTVLAMLAVILICSCSSVVNGAPKSFVDKMVYETLPFEEDSADEFINEKREINQLCEVEDMEDIAAGFHEVYVKLKELSAKEVARYGEKYVDWDAAFANTRLLAWEMDVMLTINLQERLGGREGTELKKILQDENTWKEFHSEIDTINSSGYIPLELDFRMDQKLVNFCEETLGKNDPATLKRTINLIRDYSLMGDSKTALNMEKNLLPKIEKTFGKDSSEVAEVLNLMANDYKTLGNYRDSEEALLKAIAINKKIHGEESSPVLLANLVALINLRKATSDPDAKLYDAALYDSLEKAAKNLPEDDLYRLGYFQTKILNHPFNGVKRLVDLTQACTREINLIKTYRRDYYIRGVDMLFEQSESARVLGLYPSSLAYDLTAIADCKFNLGNYHHKTLTAICNLSDDYLRLNQPDDALALAKEAYDTSKKIYGDEHPCTVYALHTLTNAYRKMNRYEDALKDDLKAYELCKKIFVKTSVNEPIETMRVLIDIADDYRGLKNYPSAIKFYEEVITKYSLNNRYDNQLPQVRKNLAYVYNRNGEYENTVELYDFLREVDYSLRGLLIGGLTAAHTADVLNDALIAVDKKEAVSKIYSQELREFEEVRYFSNTLGSTNENKREWFAQTVPYYKKAASFFVDENDAAQAFRAVELCKGRTLADQYNDLLAMYKGGLSDDDIGKLNDYQEKVFQFKNDFSEEFALGSDALKFNLRAAQIALVQEYHEYREKLREQYPKYNDALKSRQIDSGIKSEKFFNAEQIKSLIPQNHCYISFSVVKKDENSNTPSDKILTFVADDNGQIKSLSISVDDKFFNACKVYRNLLAYMNLDEMNKDDKFLWEMPDSSYKITENLQPPTGATFINTAEGFDEARQKLSEQLGEKLLAPLSYHISTKATWIISPDDELNNIPFETLQLNGKLSIESANISYVPSLAVLNLMQEAGEKNSQLQNRKELFAMGNAVYENFGDSTINARQKNFFKEIKWTNLDEEGTELKQVSILFPADSQEIITRQNASERNLKRLDQSGQLSQYKHILFNTHGIFIAERPELSSIVLSQGLGDEDYDGYVTVSEWLGYNLNSDLVYLSACETGLGEYQAGEGIIGIPYALTVAGNKNTVMSLWKVDDTSTAKFVPAFFEKLRDGKSAIQALNETKREFMQNPDAKLNSPSVWAAFLLYGL